MILKLTEQTGQTKPLKFSKTPRTGMFAFLQNESSFIQSSTETACEVVTRRAPSHGRSLTHKPDLLKISQ